MPNSDPKQPLVSVVVLNWNGANILPRSFPSLLNMSYPSYEVIFVDNGSEDDSVEVALNMAADADKQISVIRKQENLGYNQGKNAGAAAAKGKYLWLLDNDIEVKPNALSILTDFMEKHPTCALAGPLLYNAETGRREGAGMLYLPAGVPLEIHKLRRHVSDETPVAVGTILGGVTFVRKTVWDDVGGYEPSSMFAMDDSDLGPRVWASGRSVAMVPEAVAVHHALTRSTRHRQRWGFQQYIKGECRAILRNCRTGTLISACPLFLGFLLFKSIKRTIVFRDPFVPFQLIAGLFNTLCGLPESMRQRRIVQAVRRDPEDRHFHPEKYLSLEREGP